MAVILGLKQLGILLVVLLWAVGGVSLVNILHDWIRARFESTDKASHLTRLTVMGTVKRVR